MRTSSTYDTSEEPSKPDDNDEQSQPSSTVGDYDYYDDFNPRQAELNLMENVPKCGERSFTPLQNRERNQASPGEFPWMCLVLGKDEFGGWDKGGHFLYDVELECIKFV